MLDENKPKSLMVLTINVQVLTLEPASHLYRSIIQDASLPLFFANFLHDQALHSFIMLSMIGSTIRVGNYYNYNTTTRDITEISLKYSSLVIVL